MEFVTPHRKSRTVRQILGVTNSRLYSLIRENRLAVLPQRDELGHFLWSQEDIARARQALLVDRRRRPKGASA